MVLCCVAFVVFPPLAPLFALPLVESVPLFVDPLFVFPPLVSVFVLEFVPLSLCLLGSVVGVVCAGPVDMLSVTVDPRSAEPESDCEMT